MALPQMTLNGKTEGQMKKQDITQRFQERQQAERYRDRFIGGKRERTHLREVEALRRTLEPLGKVDTILDVACGPGRFAPLLKEHGSRLIQTDISKHMLDLTREDYPLCGGSGGYVLADAGQLPLRDGVADIVFCHRFLNHVPNPDQRRRIFDALARVSRKYIVAACLGRPAILQSLQSAIRCLRLAGPPDHSVTVPDFVRSAVDAGLILVSRTPIRSGMETSAFFTFTKQR